jgi:hypothetical protein
MSVMCGMPGGKRAEKYLICLEDFWVGMRHFQRGAHVAGDDPLYKKLVTRCPDRVEVVELKKLNKAKEA